MSAELAGGTSVFALRLQDKERIGEENYVWMLFATCRACRFRAFLLVFSSAQDINLPNRRGSLGKLFFQAQMRFEIRQYARKIQGANA